MKFVRERVMKFYRLPPGDRVILAQAWAFLVLADFGLWILSLGRLLKLSERVFAKECRETPPGSALSVGRMVWLVDVAGRYTPINATCLKKALVLSWLLGRRGVATTLRIGVARQEGDLQAHAWLEWKGKAITDPTAAHAYRPLFPMA